MTLPLDTEKAESTIKVPDELTVPYESIISESEIALGKKLGIGDITIATFEYTDVGDSFISKGVNRKYLFPNRYEKDPEPGEEYYVQVERDTDPFSERRGTLIGSLLEKTPKAKVIEKIKRIINSNPKSPFSHIFADITFYMEPSFEINDDTLSQLESYSKSNPDYLPVGTFKKERAIICDFSFSPDGRVATHNPSIFQADVDLSTLDMELRKFSLPDLFTEMGKTFPEEEDTEPPVEVALKIPPIEFYDNDKMRILDIEVPKVNCESPLVPSAERFKYFTLDDNTIQTVYRVASAYGRKSPLFLEGGTSVSKTSSIEFFANLVGAEVRRLNLSGQTDTSELIGKFVPNDGSTRIEFEKHIFNWNSDEESERFSVLSKMKEDSKKILIKAFNESRPLTKEESIEIAGLEGFNISDTQWVWQDGILPQAMKKGQILILDEATLAEPQILERINSALENPPSIVLSENGGVKIGPGGDFKVEKGFWIVATGNPAGYAGRNALSDAFIRRFTDYYRVPDPSEIHFKQMLELMVYGKQPTVEINGLKYEDIRKIPTEYESLSHNPDITDFINQMGAFHSDVVKMADLSTKTIGTERHREGGKYIFTRDTLIGVMNFMLNEKILDVKKSRENNELIYENDFFKKVGKAIERFYIDPVHQKDRESIKDALDKYDRRWLSGMQS